jgi:serine/threonine protein phosphatase 1
MKNIYVIGDIHGCFDQLLSLMDMIDINFDNDMLVFLGDYVDRGTDSYKTIEYLIRLKEYSENIIFLKGNHEQMLLEFFKSERKRMMYLVNGGQQTLDSYLRKQKSTSGDLFPQKHLDFISSLKMYYTTPDYIFVHAGLRDGIKLSKQTSSDLLWIRNEFIKSDYDFGKRVIFGHTPFKKPMVTKRKIGIDTGAVYGNKLTCVKLPEVKFFQI